MPRQNFKTQAKRKRELAKLDKRLAKDKRRAARRDAPAVVEPVTAAPPGGRDISPAPQKPRTLAEAAEHWKSTRIGGKPR